MPREEKKCPNCKKVQPIQGGFGISTKGPTKGQRKVVCLACEASMKKSYERRTKKAKAATRKPVIRKAQRKETFAKIDKVAQRNHVAQLIWKAVVDRIAEKMMEDLG